MIITTSHIQIADRPSYVNIFGRPIHRAWIILIGCCSLQAGGLGNILTSSGVFFVPVSDDLGFLRSEISLYISAYFLGGIVAFPIAGKLLSKYNFRIVVSVCAIACAAATALMGTYTQVWQWIASGLVFGTFGCCVLMVPYSIMISNWFFKKTGLALGIASCASAISAAFLSPFYAALIETIGWRSTYFVQGAIVALLILPWSFFVFRVKPEDIGAKPYGWSLDYDQNKVTTQIPKSSLRKTLLSIPFILCFVYAGIAVWIGSGFDSHLPGFAISIGFDSAAAALLVSALQIGSFCEKLFMGYLNDKFGVQRTIYFEFMLVIIGVLGLMHFRNFGMLLVSAFLFGVQDSLQAVSLPLLLWKIFGEKKFTQIYSWTKVGACIFGAFATVSVGYIFDVTGSFIPAFIITIMASIIGAIIVTVALRKAKLQT